MKKIVSVMLVLLMIFSSVTAIFADVVGTSYEEAVKALMDSKVVSGYTD